MTRIWTGCENLFQPLVSQPSILREDTAITILVSNVSTRLISEDSNRESLKIFVLEMSNSNTEIWLRFGLNATLQNTAFLLPLRNLFLFAASELPQIKGNLSAITNTGTALIRVSSA